MRSSRINARAADVDKAARIGPEREFGGGVELDGLTIDRQSQHALGIGPVDDAGDGSLDAMAIFAPGDVGRTEI